MKLVVCNAMTLPDPNDYEMGTVVRMLNPVSFRESIWKLEYRWLWKEDVDLAGGKEYEVDEWNFNIDPVREGMTLIDEDGGLFESVPGWNLKAYMVDGIWRRG